MVKFKKPNFLKSKATKNREKLLKDYSEGKILRIIIDREKNKVVGGENGIEHSKN